MSAQATSVGCLSDSEAALCPDHRECAITNLPTLLSDGVSYTCSAPAGLQCDSTRWRKVTPGLSGARCKATCNADLYGSNDSSLLGMAAMACSKDQFEAICKKVSGGSCSEKILGSEYWDRGAQEADEVGDSMADAAADLADGIGAFHHRMWDNNRALTLGMDGTLAGLLYKAKVHQLPVDAVGAAFKVGRGGLYAATGNSGLGEGAGRLARARAWGSRFMRGYRGDSAADSAYSPVTPADHDAPFLRLRAHDQGRGSTEGLLSAQPDDNARLSHRASSNSDLDSFSLFDHDAGVAPHVKQPLTPPPHPSRNTFI